MKVPGIQLRTLSGRSVVILVANFLEGKVPRQQERERPGFLKPSTGYSKWEMQMGNPQGQGSFSVGPATQQNIHSWALLLSFLSSSEGNLMFSV